MPLCAGICSWKHATSESSGCCNDWHFTGWPMSQAMCMQDLVVQILLYKKPLTPLLPSQAHCNKQQLRPRLGGYHTMATPGQVLHLILCINCIVPKFVTCAKAVRRQDVHVEDSHSLCDYVSPGNWSGQHRICHYSQNSGRLASRHDLLVSLLNW